MPLNIVNTGSKTIHVSVKSNTIMTSVQGDTPVSTSRAKFQSKEKDPIGLFNEAARQAAQASGISGCALFTRLSETDAVYTFTDGPVTTTGR